MPSGQHAWSNGESEILVCVPAPLGSSPSLYCAEFLSFARLRPTIGQPVLKPLIIPPARLKEYRQAPIRRHWAFFELLLAQAQEVVLVGTSVRDEDVLLVNSLNLLRLKNQQLERIVVIDPKEEIAAKVETLAEVETRRYPTLEAYVNQ